jgi:hypothetical protein
MGTYYTFDSANRLPSPRHVITVKYEPEVPELAAFLHQMYPMVFPSTVITISITLTKMEDDSGVSRSLLIGLVFELVRRSHFPDKPPAISHCLPVSI